MAKTAIALRLTPETLEWLDGYAKSRGSSRQVVLEAAVESFRVDVVGGVPDLPEAPKRRPVEEPRNLRAIYASERQAKLNAAKGSR